MAIPDLGAGTKVVLTRSPLSYIIFHPKASVNVIPLDLHVLGAPLAFILS